MMTSTCQVSRTNAPNNMLNSLRTCILSIIRVNIFRYCLEMSILYASRDIYFNQCFLRWVQVWTVCQHLRNVMVTQISQLTSYSQSSFNGAGLVQTCVWTLLMLCLAVYTHARTHQAEAHDNGAKLLANVISKQSVIFVALAKNL